jgi:hypothetical protein
MWVRYLFRLADQNPKCTVSLPHRFITLEEIESVYDLFWYLKGITGKDLKEISLEMGINPASLYWWKTGRVGPGRQSSLKIEAYLKRKGININLDDLTSIRSSG